MTSSIRIAQVFPALVCKKTRAIWKEKITYDANSTSRFKIIKRHETELKWIKLLQTPYPLGLNDNIYHEGNLSKMPDFDVFYLLEFRKRTARSHEIKKNGNCKRKSRVQKLANCTLRD